MVELFTRFPRVIVPVYLKFNGFTTTNQEVKFLLVIVGFEPVTSPVYQLSDAVKSRFLMLLHSILSTIIVWNIPAHKNYNAQWRGGGGGGGGGGRVVWQQISGHMHNGERKRQTTAITSFFTSKELLHLLCLSFRDFSWIQSYNGSKNSGQTMQFL